MPKDQLCMGVCAVNAGTRSLSLGWCFSNTALFPAAGTLPAYQAIWDQSALCTCHFFRWTAYRKCVICPRANWDPHFKKGKLPWIQAQKFIFFTWWCIKKQESSTVVPHWKAQVAKRVKYGMDIPFEQTCRGRLHSRSHTGVPVEVQNGSKAGGQQTNSPVWLQK